MGFETTTDDVLDGVRLDGRIAVVTGASTGLGIETARALAAAGAHVVLAVRSDEKGEASAARIREEVPDASLEHAVVDLASLESVRRFGAEVTGRHPAIHLLINNAGVMYTPEERTAEGFELQFGTNHLGHFLLTALLLPSLLAGAPSRIVNLSSNGHRSAGIDWDDPNYERRPYDKFSAYGQSKTANVLFTRELERRYGDRGVHAYAVHPGVIATDLGRYMTREDLKALRARITEAAASTPPSGSSLEYKTVAQGAATSVWAAVAPELEGHGGAYLADCRISDEDAPWTRDAADAARLWALSEELVGHRVEV
jgi:NAD(P)-dependent dehydrogenase (short-subunit alcohol dehydrogenase family)